MMTNDNNGLSRADIATEDDIRVLVHRFYDKVRADDQLAPVFNAVIAGDEWPGHLQIMCDFWSTLLLYTRQYTSDPMSKHMPLPIERAHFDRWLLLFGQTVDEHFLGEVANEAKRRAANIARVMNHLKSRS